MKKPLHLLRNLFLILTIVLLWFSGFHITVIPHNDGLEVKPELTPEANAHYQFIPSNGQLVTGTEQTILSATAASNEGVNTGSWKGTLADDNFHWVVASTSSGVNVQLVVGGVQLNGANIFVIQTEFDLDATAPDTLIQICDWTSTTSVDNAADGQCTGGGWRTINNRKVVINTTTPTGYNLYVYDGYWTNGSNTAISTPLTNFVNGSSQIRIRYYSTTNTTSTVAIDYLRINAVVNPIYAPAGFTNVGSGTVTGDYMSTSAINQGASDDVRLQVAGTAGSVADFYLSFKNVKTYTGMNTILLRAEHSCSTTGINYRPKIYNFNSSSWEDLTTTSIGCSASDTTNIFAKNNVTVSNYINNGEVRVGWYGLSNSTVALRIDQMYIILGSTNADTNDCEISFGTLNSGTCANTRDIDTTAATSSWQINTEDESNTFGHAYYPYDNDADGTVGEAAAENISFPVTVPTNTAVTGFIYAGRQLSGTGGTVQPKIFDYSGTSAGNGGWLFFGMAFTSGFAYGDNITVGGVAWGNPGTGVPGSPDDFVDSVNNKMNMRLNTAADGATSNNSVNQWDFAMVSIQWTEDSAHPTSTNQFIPTSGQLVTGTEQTILAATAPSTEGVNTGSWKATLADDNFHWAVASTASGLDAQLITNRTQLNGATTLIIRTEFDLDATAPDTLVQICDWTSTASVDNAADAQCTGGGWRTLNNRKVVINTTTPTAYTWMIYDGYWTDGANTSISTPLTNFVNGSNQMRLRFYSTTNTTSVVSIDYLRYYAVMHPMYFPAGFTNLGSGAVTGDYMSTNNVTQGASDDVRLQVAGTAGSVADFYLSFKNIKTYTGMNTVYIRGEYSCSNTGINSRPKIYNFNSASWEDLTTSSLACSTGDNTLSIAKNNVTISNYISNGEMRIGWRTLSNSTIALRIDAMYIMVGTTNTDSNACEISFGTLSAGTCSNTRDVDSSGTASTWNVATEDESNTFGHTYYPYDNDADAVVGEAGAANLKFSVTSPNNASVTSWLFASRHMSGTGGTVQFSLGDYAGFTSATGGFSSIGTGGTTSLFPADSLQSGAPLGSTINPEDYVNTVDNQMWARLRTSTAGATSNNSVNQWDFAMIGLQWSETKLVYNQAAYRFFNNTNSTDVGTALAAQNTNPTLGTTGAAFRLRMLMHLDNDDLRLSQKNFKLQYVGKGSGSCASPTGGTPASYTDVTGSTLIAYNNNATPADGAALTTNANDPTHNSDLVRSQTYVESNNFTNTQKIMNSGQDGLWDFSLIDNGAAQATAYCFRMVESDGTAFSTYTVYPQVTTTATNLTFSISDNTIGYGSLSSSAARWATGDTLGSNTETSAHTLSVSTSSTGGYTLYVLGDTLTSGLNTITAIGGSATASSPGSEQFGVRATVSGGTGSVISPYNTSNYAYAATSAVQDDIGQSTAASSDTYTVYYLGNVANTTEAGSYATSLIYTVTGSF